jgi:hypothetical protein
MRSVFGLLQSRNVDNVFIQYDGETQLGPMTVADAKAIINAVGKEVQCTLHYTYNEPQRRETIVAPPAHDLNALRRVMRDPPHMIHNNILNIKNTIVDMINWLGRLDCSMIYNRRLTRIEREYNDLCRGELYGSYDRLYELNTTFNQLFDEVFNDLSISLTTRK